MKEQNDLTEGSGHLAASKGVPVGDALPGWAEPPDRAVQTHGPGDAQTEATSPSSQPAPPSVSPPAGPPYAEPAYAPPPYPPAPGYPLPAPPQAGDGGGGWPTPPSAGPPMSPPRRSSASLVALLVAIAVLVAAGIGVVIGHVAWTSSTTPVTSPLTTSPPSTAPISSSPGAPSDSAAIAADVDPALVDIEVTDSYQSVEGFGTGMVLSSNGEVLTNNHVIEGETSISVTDVGNGKTYGATVVGYDVTQDVAVIQLTGASGLKTVRLGDSSDLKVGQSVVAIGNAEGAGGTPSYSGGSITALDQSITAQDEISGASEQLTGLIETNADVVPGDSGGALANSTGAVIGMDTAGSESFQFQGTSNEGYAIPINEASGIASQIEAHQASSTVHIGPTAFLGVEVMSPFRGISGAEIVGVVPSGPAVAAGLATGDVITALDGQPVSSPESLTDLLLGETPGTSVQVQYLDPSGQQHTLSVTLASGPPQ